MVVSKWIQTSSPIVKILMLVSVTTGVVGLHNYIYKPYVKKQSYRRAEEWANMIIEQEERGEDGPNNISY